MSGRAETLRDGGRGRGGLSSQCGAIKGNGERCGGRATEGSQWCYSHNPNHQDQHRRNGFKGGKRGGRGRASASCEVHEVKEELRDIVDLVRSGRMDRASANTCGYLLNTQLKAIETGMRAKEHEEFAEEIAELKERAEQWSEGR